MNRLIARKSCLPAIVLLLLFFTSSGQSVQVELKQAKSDEQKLEVYKKTFKHFEFSNLDSAKFYMNQGLTEFTLRRYKHGVGVMLSRLSAIYSAKGMLDLAEKTGNEAMAILQAGSDKKEIAKAHNILGVVFGRKCVYPSSVDHFLKAMSIYSSLHDTDGLLSCYVKLGNVNQVMGNLDKAMGYFNAGLMLGSERKGNKDVIFTYNNLASIYFRKGQKDIGISYLLKSLDLCKEPENIDIRILPLVNLGLCYDEMGNTAKGLEYLEQAEAIAEKENLPEEQARTLNDMASVLAKNDRKKAAATFERAYIIAKSAGFKKLQEEILQGVIDIDLGNNDFKEAYMKLKEQSAIKDTLNTLEKYSAVASLESEYKFEDMNNTITGLEFREADHRKFIIYLSVLVGIMCVGAAFLMHYIVKYSKANKNLAANEAKLEQALKRRDQFFSILGHDLINNISVMPMALELCKTADMGEKERNDLLQLMENNAISSLETLENLLNWGKLQMKGVIKKMELIVLPEDIANEIAMTGITATSKNVTIINQIPPNTRILADKNHVKFVFRNILSNAVKYSPQHSAVTISCRPGKNDRDIVFAIHDTGMGLTPEKQKEIFNFYVDSEPGTEQETGNGIGLKICKEFIQQNGGNICVESTPGTGTTFFFSFPIA